MNAVPNLIEQVAAYLTEAAYRPLPQPLTIASVPFEFAAVFVGTDHSSDLVVLLDTVHEREEFGLRRKLEGLSRGLDLVRSKRPLTAILIGPKPRARTLDLISRFCRVLIVSPPSQVRANWLIDALSVLLPLRLPQHEDLTTNPITELEASLSNAVEEALLESVVIAARIDAEEVQKVFRNLVQESAIHDDGIIDKP